MKMDDFQIGPLVRKRLLEQNKNWLAVFCGPTGSGKSYCALTTARQIDPEFTIERVVFKIEDLMNLLNSGKLKKGNAIVFDEAGVGIPAREWYSISNKAMGYLMQTFRNLNLAVILTTPNLGYIDTQIRGLFHAYIETERIDRKARKVEAKYYFIRATPRTGKIYYKYPRVFSESGKETIVDAIYIPAPDAKLSSTYEKKKTEFTQQLNMDIHTDIRGMTKTASGQPRKLNPIHVSYILTQRKKGMSYAEIKKHLFARYQLKVSPMTILNSVKAVNASK
jgi:hypothetical protein